MEDQNIPSNISDKSAQMIARMFDLIMGRVFKNIYLKLDDENGKKMEDIFLSEDDKAKEEFIEKYVSRLEELFNAEAAKLGEEIKEKM